MPRMLSVLLQALASCLILSGCATKRLYEWGGADRFTFGSYTRALLLDDRLYLEVKERGLQPRVGYLSFPLNGLNEAVKTNTSIREICATVSPGVSVLSLKPLSIDPSATIMELELRSVPNEIFTVGAAVRAADIDSHRKPKIILLGSCSSVLLYLPKPAQQSTAVYALGPVKFGERRVLHESRSWWSYPVLILATPLAVAADVVLVPLAAIAGGLYLTGSAANGIIDGPAKPVEGKIRDGNIGENIGHPNFPQGKTQ